MPNVHSFPIHFITCFSVLHFPSKESFVPFSNTLYKILIHTFAGRQKKGKEGKDGWGEGVPCVCKNECESSGNLMTFWVSDRGGGSD